MFKIFPAHNLEFYRTDVFAKFKGGFKLYLLIEI